MNNLINETMKQMQFVEQYNESINIFYHLENNKILNLMIEVFRADLQG